MKNVWLILIFIIISCSSESDNFVQYEKMAIFLQQLHLLKFIILMV